MDSSFEDIISENLEVNKHDLKKKRGPRIPPPNIYILGGKHSTDEKRKELNGDVLPIKIREGDFQKQLDEMSQRAADILSGRRSVEIGKSNHQKCFDRMSCGKTHDHGLFHPKAYWILWDILSVIYETPAIGDNKADKLDLWGVIEEAPEGYTMDGSELNISVRKNLNLEKTKKLFLENIPAYFAGKIPLERIGRPDKQRVLKWCEGPVCIRTLCSSSLSQSMKICNNCHSDEVSVLTSIMRILLDTSRKQNWKHPSLDESGKVHSIVSANKFDFGDLSE